MPDEKQELFETGPDDITLHGIDTAVKFTRFNAQKPNLFLSGIILSQDLKNEEVVLYTKGTEITPDRMGRLVRMGESNTKLKLSFSIKRTPELMQSIRKEITGRMHKIISERLQHKVFANFFEVVKKEADLIFDDVLSDERFLLAIYKMRFVARLAKAELAREYFDHLLKLSLFALGMTAAEQYRSILREDEGKKRDLVKLALIHSYEALADIDPILEKPETVRLKKYWEAIRKGYFVLGTFNLGFDVMDALRMMCEYYLGEMKALGHKDVVDKSEWPKTMSNILIVLDMYLQKESGFYEGAVSPRRAIDLLNVLATEKRLNEQAVAALTLSLNFRQIFEFYREIDMLLGECPSKTAWPYPLTGFKSPTLFICKDKCAECDHMQHSGHAVKLVKPLRDLDEGDYRRCNLLTPKLTKFYEDHYGDIKEETAERSKNKK